MAGGQKQGGGGKKRKSSSNTRNRRTRRVQGTDVECAESGPAEAVGSRFDFYRFVTVPEGLADRLRELGMEYMTDSVLHRAYAMRSVVNTKVLPSTEGRRGREAEAGREVPDLTHGVPPGAMDLIQAALVRSGDDLPGSPDMESRGRWRTFLFDDRRGVPAHHESRRRAAVDAFAEAHTFVRAWWIQGDRLVTRVAEGTYFPVLRSPFGGDIMVALMVPVIMRHEDGRPPSLDTDYMRARAFLYARLYNSGLLTIRAAPDEDEGSAMEEDDGSARPHRDRKRTAVVEPNPGVDAEARLRVERFADVVIRNPDLRPGPWHAHPGGVWGWVNEAPAAAQAGAGHEDPFPPPRPAGERTYSASSAGSRGSQLTGGQPDNGGSTGPSQRAEQAGETRDTRSNSWGRRKADGTKVVATPREDGTVEESVPEMPGVINHRRFVTPLAGRVTDQLAEQLQGAVSISQPQDVEMASVVDSSVGGQTPQAAVGADDSDIQILLDEVMGDLASEGLQEPMEEKDDDENEVPQIPKPGVWKVDGVTARLLPSGRQLAAMTVAEAVIALSPAVDIVRENLGGAPAPSEEQMQEFTAELQQRIRDGTFPKGERADQLVLRLAGARRDAADERVAREAAAMAGARTPEGEGMAEPAAAQAAATAESQQLTIVVPMEADDADNGAAEGEQQQATGSGDGEPTPSSSSGSGPGPEEQPQPAAAPAVQEEWVTLVAAEGTAPAVQAWNRDPEGVVLALLGGTIPPEVATEAAVLRFQRDWPAGRVPEEARVEMEAQAPTHFAPMGVRPPLRYNIAYGEVRLLVDHQGQTTTFTGFVQLIEEARPLGVSREDLPPMVGPQYYETAVSLPRYRRVFLAPGDGEEGMVRSSNPDTRYFTSREEMMLDYAQRAAIQMYEHLPMPVEFHPSANQSLLNPCRDLGIDSNLMIGMWDGAEIFPVQLNRRAEFYLAALTFVGNLSEVVAVGAVTSDSPRPLGAHGVEMSVAVRALLDTLRHPTNITSISNWVLYPALMELVTRIHFGMDLQYTVGTANVGMIPTEYRQDQRVVTMDAEYEGWSLSTNQDGEVHGTDIRVVYDASVLFGDGSEPALVMETLRPDVIPGAMRYARAYNMEAAVIRQAHDNRNQRWRWAYEGSRAPTGAMMRRVLFVGGVLARQLATALQASWTGLEGQQPAGIREVVLAAMLGLIRVPSEGRPTYVVFVFDQTEAWPGSGDLAGQPPCFQQQQAEFLDQTWYWYIPFLCDLFLSQGVSPLVMEPLQVRVNGGGAMGRWREFQSGVHRQNVARMCRFLHQDLLVPTETATAVFGNDVSWHEPAAPHQIRGSGGAGQAGPNGHLQVLTNALGSILGDRANARRTIVELMPQVPVPAMDPQPIGGPFRFYRLFRADIAGDRLVVRYQGSVAILQRKEYHNNLLRYLRETALSLGFDLAAIMVEVGGLTLNRSGVPIPGEAPRLRLTNVVQTEVTQPASARGFKTVARELARDAGSVFHHEKKDKDDRKEVEIEFLYEGRKNLMGVERAQGKPLPLGDETPEYLWGVRGRGITLPPVRPQRRDPRTWAAYAGRVNRLLDMLQGSPSRTGTQSANSRVGGPGRAGQSATVNRPMVRPRRGISQGPPQPRPTIFSSSQAWRGMPSPPARQQGLSQGSDTTGVSTGSGAVAPQPEDTAERQRRVLAAFQKFMESLPPLDRQAFDGQGLVGMPQGVAAGVTAPAPAQPRWGAPKVPWMGATGTPKSTSSSIGEKRPRTPSASPPVTGVPQGGAQAPTSRPPAKRGRILSVLDSLEPAQRAAVEAVSRASDTRESVARYLQPAAASISEVARVMAEFGTRYDLMPPRFQSNEAVEDIADQAWADLRTWWDRVDPQGRATIDAEVGRGVWASTYHTTDPAVVAYQRLDAWFDVNLGIGRTRRSEAQEMLLRRRAYWVRRELSLGSEAAVHHTQESLGGGSAEHPGLASAHLDARLDFVRNILFQQEQANVGLFFLAPEAWVVWWAITVLQNHDLPLPGAGIERSPRAYVEYVRQRLQEHQTQEGRRLMLGAPAQRSRPPAVEPMVEEVAASERGAPRVEERSQEAADMSAAAGWEEVPTRNKPPSQPQQRTAAVVAASGKATIKKSATKSSTASKSAPGSMTGGYFKSAAEKAATDSAQRGQGAAIPGANMVAQPAPAPTLEEMTVAFLIRARRTAGWGADVSEQRLGRAARGEAQLPWPQNVDNMPLDMLTWFEPPPVQQDLSEADGWAVTMARLGYTESSPFRWAVVTVYRVLLSRNSFGYNLNAGTALSARAFTRGLLRQALEIARSLSYRFSVEPEPNTVTVMQVVPPLPRPTAAELAARGLGPALPKGGPKP